MGKKKPRFRPMLAQGGSAKRPLTLEALSYPLAASPKLDGFRAVVLGGKLLSRNLKPIPNRVVRKWIEGLRLSGFDGELVVGPPGAPDCFNLTSSQITTRNAGREGVAFHVFDCFSRPAEGYRARRAELMLARLPEGVVLVPQKIVSSAAQASEFEAQCIADGYEGIILRSLDGYYKYGRSTAKEQLLLKIKRFAESEARIVSVYPRMRNDNAATTDERGYSKRRKLKENLVALPELGGFNVIDLRTRKPHRCAPGVLTRKQRQALWKVRKTLPGKTINHRHQAEGAHEKPRFTRFRGFRSRIDF